MKAKVPKTVDEYLAAVPDEVRPALDKLRADIRSAAPKAEEVISYQVPCYKQNGMLVGFGVAKKHCSFYSGTSPIVALKEELKTYETSKGTIRFPAAKPLPTALVKKIVKMRIAEMEAKRKP